MFQFQGNPICTWLIEKARFVCNAVFVSRCSAKCLYSASDFNKKKQQQVFRKLSAN